MNVSEDKREEIIRLCLAGNSQNQIAFITGVSKPYVNAICSELKGSDKAISGLGVGPNNLQQQVNQPSMRNSYYPENNSLAELRYKDQRISDLEIQLKDFKNELNKLSVEHTTLQKEHAALQIEHKSIEAKHQYEKDNIVAQNTFSQKSSLDGLMDKVVTPILNNQKLVDAISIGLIHKLSGGGTQPQQQIQQVSSYDHPLINTPETGTQIQEVLEVFKQFNAQEIEKLHTLFGVFILERGMINSVTTSAVDYVRKKQNSQQQTT
jgi:hypothetical protein